MENKPKTTFYARFANEPKQESLHNYPPCAHGATEISWLFSCMGNVQLHEEAHGYECFDV